METIKNNQMELLELINILTSYKKTNWMYLTDSTLHKKGK